MLTEAAPAEKSEARYGCVGAALGGAIFSCTSKKSNPVTKKCPAFSRACLGFDCAGRESVLGGVAEHLSRESATGCQDVLKLFDHGLSQTRCLGNVFRGGTHFE